MKQFKIISVLLCCVASGWADEASKTSEPITAAPPVSAPTTSTSSADLKELQELITLLRAHYADRDSLSDKAITSAAMEGVLRRLGPGAHILSQAEAAKSADENAPAIAKQRVFTPSVGYVRIGTFHPGVAATVEETLGKLAKQKLNGLILDLRFANGHDFGEAAALAGLFVDKEKPLICLQAADGTTTRRFDNPREPTFANLPLILLVNGDTRGAPEALAGVLQQYKRALIIGNPSAGECFSQTDLPLGDGKVLRLATARVVVAHGTTLWPRSVEPTIVVKIEPVEEKAIVFETSPKKEKKPVYAAGSIRSEAELLSIYETDGESPPRAASPELQEQTDDPVLQRALDVLSAWHTFQPAPTKPASTP